MAAGKAVDAGHNMPLVAVQQQRQLTADAYSGAWGLDDGNGWGRGRGGGLGGGAGGDKPAFLAFSIVCIYINCQP
jgi:hypothetical protein